MNLLAVVTSAQPAGHVRPWEWLLFGVPLVALLAMLTYLLGTGDPGKGHPLLAPVRRLANSLERLTGLPAWAAGGIMAGEWSLLLAALGFYWDVAWHIDFGRDKALFTPPHLMILVGLAGILGAGILSITLATVQQAAVGRRVGRLHVPHGALPLVGLGLFAVIGFPLDDLWHLTYGIDVTMWSPTHLMMIGGACFSPLGLRLLLVEAGPEAVQTTWGKVLRRGLTSAILVALTAFQLEFDLGVPQWQALYQPVMIMGSSALVMIAARESMGRGGALVLWVNYLVLRLFWFGLIGPVLGHVSPHFPLYLGVALVVEAVWQFGGRLRPLPRAVVAGGLIGTVGLASEWAWSAAFARHPWHLSLFPGIWVAVLMAVAAAVLGLAIGSVLDHRRPQVPTWLVVGAGLGVVALMAVPFPRHSSNVTARVTASPAGEPQQAVDRDGRPAVTREYNIHASLQPADAAAGADYFEVMAWQGGKARLIPMVPEGNGNFHSARSVPTGGTWKTGLFLTNRDVLDALPLSMPADSEYGAAAVKIAPTKDARLLPAEKVLMAENHTGTEVPRYLAVAGFVAELAVTTLFFILAFVGLTRGFPAGPPRSGRRRSPGLRTARAT
ncbi:MAG: hypothetical protein NVSMB17_16210 [Candidatus Dormibacteria bacterium]